jgi:hypothetical protein
MAEAAGPVIEAAKGIAQWLVKKGHMEIDVYEQIIEKVELLKKYRRGYGATGFEKTYDRCDALLAQMFALADFYQRDTYSGVYLAVALATHKITAASIIGALRWGDSLDFVTRDDLIRDRFALKNFLGRLKKNAITLMRQSKFGDDFKKLSAAYNSKKLTEMAAQLEAEVAQDAAVDMNAEVEAVAGER